jgi:hypothetical protein
VTRRDDATMQQVAFEAGARLVRSILQQPRPSAQAQRGGGRAVGALPAGAAGGGEAQKRPMDAETAGHAAKRVAVATS